MFVCYSAAFCQLCFYNKDWMGFIYPTVAGCKSEIVRCPVAWKNSLVLDVGSLLAIFAYITLPKLTPWHDGLTYIKTQRKS